MEQILQQSNIRPNVSLIAKVNSGP